MVERKSKNRMRLVQMRTPGQDDKSAGERPSQEIVGIALGYRVMISEMAEVWTLSGALKDGTYTKEEVGELSFALIPGEEQPATAVTGFVAPAAPYVLAVPQVTLQQQLRAVIAQLGYDRDGYYISLGIGGQFFFDDNYRET
jgi:hypothetical protein